MMSAVIVPAPIFIPSGGAGVGDMPWQIGVTMLVLMWLAVGLFTCAMYRMEHGQDGRDGLLSAFNLALFFLWPVMLLALGLRYAWRHR